MKSAIFRFDEQLAQLVRGRSFDRNRLYCFTGPQSVKHLLEGLGVPHTEIGHVIVRGAPVGLNYLVADGDCVDLLGAKPEPTAIEPKFALDGHLTRLNARLRMLGFDCFYSPAASDAELAETARHGQRILLTRDRRLLMRKTIGAGYLVRDQDPRAQLREVGDRFGLTAWMRPFSRCIRCNGLLRPVEKLAVVDRLQPLTRLYYDEFRTCLTCGQTYWPGSHLARMQRVVDEFLGGLQNPATPSKSM